MSSINSITRSISNYKGEELSISTKIRLEALGIEPSSVNTEAQAQIIIAQAEAATNHGSTNNNQGGNSTREQLVSEARELAQKVGVQVVQGDSLENILEKISKKLNLMAQDPSKAEMVQEFQAELTDIAQRADVMVKVQKNIFNTLEMISLSNRIILGL